MDPTPERFQRLARSAPYRWRSLLLVGTWRPGVERLRVRVEQPDLLRVERLDGAVLVDGRQGSLGSVTRAPVLELDADGLVTTARQPWDDGPELPMWQDYRFVAVLDPYELSDGVDVLELAAVQHHGRPAWEALLRPTAGYAPRCACCPLMRTRDTDLAEGLDPLPAYAEAHRVRLDVTTGVCVSTREVGGPGDGSGHDLEIESWSSWPA